MGYLHFAAMTGIVHDECSCGLLLLDDFGHLGISLARRTGLTLVGIPHHFLDKIAGITGGHILGSIVGIFHVQVAIAVITHEHECVLPCPGIGIGGIVDGLVYQDLSILGIGYGETPHADVEPVGFFEIGALTIVQQSEPAIVYIAGDFIEGVFALEAKQMVVGIEVAALGGKHAIIPHAVAEEQEILGHRRSSGGTVVHHL